jgi:hypothetical protein
LYPQVLLAHSLKQFKTIHPRHVDIEQHQVDPAIAQPGQSTSKKTPDSLPYNYTKPTSPMATANSASGSARQLAQRTSCEARVKKLRFSVPA